MKMPNKVGFILLGAIVLAGCATTDGPKPEKGPKGTIAYFVEIESSEPGARVEANNEFVGKTPFTLKLFGDKRVRLRNFGNPFYPLTAYPVRVGQQTQIRDSRTGGWFTSEDRIPQGDLFSGALLHCNQSHHFTNIL